MIAWLKKHNIAVWALSFVLAVVFWLYVDITQDTEREKTLNIRVVFMDQEMLFNERDIIVTSDLNDMRLQVRLHGKSSDLALCTETSMQAVIHMNRISDAGTHPVYFDITKDIQFPEQVGQRVTVTSYSPSYFTVTFDRMESRTFEVKVKRDNIIVPEGYKLENTLSDPPQVKVRGPSEQLRQIDAVQVTLPNREVTQTVSFTSSVTLVDAEGNEILSDELTVDPKEVDVKLVISRVKKVDLDVKLIEGGGAKIENVLWTIDPPSVTLTGDPVVLDTIGGPITVGSIDLTSVTEGQRFPFTFEIPIGTECDVKPEVTVTVRFTGLATKKFTTANINLVGASPPEGYDVKQITQSLSLTLRGPAADIERIADFNIRVTVDLTGVDLARGLQNVPVKVSVDGFPNVGAMGEPMVAVELVEAAEP